MKYVRVNKWSSKDDGIQVEMLADDQEIHRIDISAECAEALAAGLAAELEKTRAEDRRQQFIRPTGIQTGKTAQGEPLLFITLDGGTELPLVFRAEALAPLISELEKLQAMLQGGPQIRWN